MVFVEFTSSNGYPCNGAKHYFVGASLQDVMNDTAGGTEFGFSTFSSHREISEADARALKLGYLDDGIKAIEKGTLSYKLGWPDEMTEDDLD